MAATRPTKNLGLAAYQARVRAQKRNALLDSAVKLFLAKGYDNTTLEDVSRDSQVSTATLYKRFPSKAALFGGIMERLWSLENTGPSAGFASGNPTAGLLSIGKDYAQLLAGDQMVALFRVIIAEMPRFPELGEELYLRGKKPYLDRLNQYIEQEVALGTLNVENVQIASRQFLGMINDLVFWPRLLVASADMSAVERNQVVEEAVRTFLERYRGLT